MTDINNWQTKMAFVNRDFNEHCDWIEYHDLYHGRANAIMQYPLYKNALIYGQYRRHLQHLTQKLNVPQ